MSEWGRYKKMESRREMYNLSWNCKCCGSVCILLLKCCSSSVWFSIPITCKMFSFSHSKLFIMIKKAHAARSDGKTDANKQTKPKKKTFSGNRNAKWNGMDIFDINTHYHSHIMEIMTAFQFTFRMPRNDNLFAENLA